MAVFFFMTKAIPFSPSSFVSSHTPPSFLIPFSPLHPLLSCVMHVASCRRGVYFLHRAAVSHAVTCHIFNSSINFNVEFNAVFVKSAEFDVFHSNNYFFTQNDLKLTLLQVCL